ncbi:hypothetical protein RHS01_03561 [Rhizoctonia solani]|uniref:Retrotransposon gag domain-containing protein n=1 Tax=Rhizoctonia solani TaxID=456999 RepID=A0A8H7IL38_9AGAM|nr:hypothetical protein RHS01_03561 [Rhizoctonia solani]
MEPEPTLSALLEAITALTATVGSLQAKSHPKANSSLSSKPYAGNRRPLLGIKTKEPKLSLAHGWACHSPTYRHKEKRTLQERLGLDSRPLSAHQEERALTQRKRKNPGEPPKGSLATRLNGASAPSPHLTQGPAAQSSRARVTPQPHPALTAKFKEAFADPDAKRAAARKIAALTQSTTTAEYVTEFRNLMAELDWNTEAFIAQFTRGLHWKVKDSCPPRTTFRTMISRPIFAASIKIDNIRRENEENALKRRLPNPGTVATTLLPHTTGPPI